jgi:hypothetical protein
MELRYYQTAAGERPFVEWLEDLNDRQARTRIEARLARVAVGNFGDVEPVGEGVMELRIAPKAISKTTKRATRKRSRVAAASLPYEGWLVEQLKDPAEAAAYLERAA